MMEFRTDISRQTLLVEGVSYTAPEILRARMRFPDGGGALGRELSDFLAEWFSPSDTLTVHTSGSTGTPKALTVGKDRMMRSACLTCSFLGLKERDSALLCLPLKYIAGRMVVVRSLVAGLDLWPVAPSGRPLKGLKRAPAFAAMIPMQVYDSLQDPDEKRLLRGIRHLIIGGGAVDPLLAEELKDFPHAVWSTYGMTETLSHIAMRRINGPGASEWYAPLEGVDIRTGREGTLVIRAPHVCEGEIETNDIAEVRSDGRFRVLGRRDNTINSGGVKIQTEQVEALLTGHLPDPFLITSAPDPKFGEIVVLLTEGDAREYIGSLCERVLPEYWRPKRIVSVRRIPLTETGKPDRRSARELAREPALPESPLL